MQPHPFRRARSPQRSSVHFYLNELAEIRQYLERSGCRAWWAVAVLELMDYPTLVVHGAAHCHAVGAQPQEMVAVGDVALPPAQRNAVFAISFRQRTMGVLTLRLLPHCPLEPQHTAAFAELASQCARILQRLLSQQWMVRSRLGAPCLIGSSEAMLELDRRIEACCADDRPVLLLGSTGNEALQTAVALHCSGHGAEQPFVQIDCANTLEPPARWIDRARGGTLFLSNLDCGTLADQEHLWQQLAHALQPPAPCSHSEVGIPDASASVPLGQRWACRLVVAQKSLHPSVCESNPVAWGCWSQREWYCIHLPPVSQRAQDIELLTRSVLDYHGHGADYRLSDALQHWCRNYCWPGNASQLEWIVARMALLTANTRITAADISQHAPLLLKDDYGAEREQGANPPDRFFTAPADNGNAGLAVLPDVPDTQAQPIDYWVRCVLEQNTQALASLPAGLHRALQYVGKNYQEPISTEQLAEESFVSASHLRFLFRNSLGISFKLFLQNVRIAHAKLLLQEVPPRRISDVALSVGFNDFSHFQKCFRQIMGQTPGKLRRGGILATTPP